MALKWEVDFRENTINSEPVTTAIRTNRIPATVSFPSLVLVFSAIYTTPKMPMPRNTFCPSVVFSFKITDSQIQLLIGAKESRTPAVMPVVIEMPSVSKSISAPARKLRHGADLWHMLNALSFSKHLVCQHLSLKI